MRPRKSVLKVCILVPKVTPTLTVSGSRTSLPKFRTKLCSGTGNERVQICYSEKLPFRLTLSDSLKDFRCVSVILRLSLKCRSRNTEFWSKTKKTRSVQYHSEWVETQGSSPTSVGPCTTYPVTSESRGTNRNIINKEVPEAPSGPEGPGDPWFHSRTGSFDTHGAQRQTFSCTFLTNIRRGQWSQVKVQRVE